MSNYSIKWDEAVPLGTGSKSLGDNYLRDNLTAVRERLATEHSNATGSSGDALVRHNAGKCSVFFYGTTAEINALTGMPQYAVALDTTLGVLKYYTGAAWNIATWGSFDWDTCWTDAVHSHASDPEGGVLSTYYQKTDTILGTWATKAEDTVYQAATDGFVVATVIVTGAADRTILDGYTDSSNPPTTLRGCASGYGVNLVRGSSFTLPVKKNDYYKVVKNVLLGTPTVTVFWIPLGS